MRRETKEYFKGLERLNLTDTYRELIKLDGNTLFYTWKEWREKEKPKLKNESVAAVCNSVFAKAFDSVIGREAAYTARTEKEKALKTANVQA